VRYAVAVLLCAIVALPACGDDDGGGGGEAGGPDRVRVQDTAGVPSAFLAYGI
jgi:hypothetical protein